MSQQQEYNPFAPRERVPAVSWNGAPVGGFIVARVLEAPREVQARDFATGKVETWDNGDPKMNVVTRVDVNGETRDLWCVRPSALYGAIVEALKQTPPGYLEVGGTLRITYTGEKPSEKAGMNPAKQFAVQYTAANAFGQPNGAQTWQQPAQQQQQQTQQQPAQQQADPWMQQQQPDEPPF
jgi:hypothetical protein